MNSIKHRFILDMHSAQSQISLPALLGDTGRELHISFTDGGNPYYIETGCIAKLSVKRPTGTHFVELCTIANNTTVIYKFSQNENTCAVEGIHDCDITLYDTESEQIASPRFSIIVSEKAIASDDINITDEDRTDVEAMLKAEAARVQADAERGEAEKARKEAEIARVGVEAERAEAEASRDEAEGKRRDAETERGTAETARKDAETTRQTEWEAEKKAIGELKTELETSFDIFKDETEESINTFKSDAEETVDTLKGEVETAIDGIVSPSIMARVEDGAVTLIVNDKLGRKEYPLPVLTEDIDAKLVPNFTGTMGGEYALKTLGINGVKYYLIDETALHINDAEVSHSEQGLLSGKKGSIFTDVIKIGDTLRLSGGTLNVAEPGEGGGTLVIANPEDEATETMTAIEIGGVVYSLGGGTEVIANPACDGTENTLNYIKIGDTIYDFSDVNALKINCEASSENKGLLAGQIGNSFTEVIEVGNGLKLENGVLSSEGVDTKQLNSAVENALTQAKESGEFKGDPYTLTEADKAIIVADVISSLGGSPIFGVVDENNNIILNGNLTEKNYFVKYEMEDGSEVDIGELAFTFTISKNLNYCTISNDAINVNRGGSYAATLSANKGYVVKSIKVTMGGVDISSTAVNGNNISIANVTGNIVIDAIAEVYVPPYTDLAHNFEAGRFDSAGNVSQTNISHSNVYACTDIIGKLENGDVIRIKGMGNLSQYVAVWMNESKSVYSSAKLPVASELNSHFTYEYDSANDIVTVTKISATKGYSYVKFSGIVTTTTEDVVITLNEPIV